MLRTLALILAGGQGTRLSVLAQKRAKPAVPFAGKYRIIDFTLSNCVNSGLTTVGIVTQYLPRSLNDHIRNGRPWDLDTTPGGVTLLQPYQVSPADRYWYRGTAEAVYHNLDYVHQFNPDWTLILSGDHVYKMDYRPLLRYHEEKKAHLTVCASPVPMSEASRFGILSLSGEEPGRVSQFEEKPQFPEGDLASMGIYVFNTEVLSRLLTQDAQEEGPGRDFGKDILPRMLSEGYRVYGYVFGDYWVDVGTVQAYWEAHMDLLEDSSPLDLMDRQWIIHTRSEERPPVNVRTGASIGHSLLADGCVIEGAVEYSVLSPGVRVKPGAIVRSSVVLTDSVIDEMAVVDRAIVDKNVHIGSRARIGAGSDIDVANETDPRLDTGLSLIGKNAIVPPGTTIGRNCVIASDVTVEAFASRMIESGRTIGTAT